MNITYYLGAGASANALPVVATMNDRMQFFINGLDLIDKREILNIELNIRERSPVQKKFQELLNQTRKHASIDTFAKKLHIKKQTRDLRLLKTLLSSYLIYEQLNEADMKELQHNNVYQISKFEAPTTSRQFEIERFKSKIETRIDYRYDSFFATLLSADNKRLGNNINIISWNYDSQIELAYADFVNSSIDVIREDLDMFPNSRSELTESEDDPKIIKLNGTAGLFYGKDKKESISDHSSQSGFDIELLKFMLGHAVDLLNPAIPRLPFISYPFVNFAWEKNETGYQAKGVEEAKKIIDKTNILVVIGYSFPTFNRDVDKEILNDNELDKIYIQAPAKDMNAIKQRILGLLGNSVAENMFFPHDEIEQFLIPYEM